MTRVGVVGHVEWVQFAVVERVPAAGEIVHARESFFEPAGGGAVAAVQLRKLAGSALFLTALGNDAAAASVSQQLRERFGVELFAAAARRAAAAHVHVSGRSRRADDHGARRADRAGRRRPAAVGAAGVAGRDLPDRRRRRGGARRPRGERARRDAARDGRAGRVGRAARRARAQRDRSRRVLRAGHARPAAALGGQHARASSAGRGRGETSGSWEATPLPGPPVDAYGCGDSFAAALAYGLGAGMALPEAIELGARCGAACLCGRGPYAGQLELS